jgi:hypothetical protein
MASRTARAIPTSTPSCCAACIPSAHPEHCLNTLTSTTCRTGIDHVILLVEGAGDRARTLENITRLGAEILPLLQGSTPRTSG